MCWRFADGASRWTTDIVVFSAGIRPQDAARAGLRPRPWAERGGIVIDDSLRAPATRISTRSASARCAQRQDCTAWWRPATRWPRSPPTRCWAATRSSSRAPDMSTKLKLHGRGRGLASATRFAATTDSQRARWSDERRRASTRNSVLSAGRHAPASAASLVGDAHDYGSWLQFMLNAMPLPAKPEVAAGAPTEGGEATGMGVAALPAGAQICSCNNVSKGDICRGGGRGRGDAWARMKKATKAGQHLRRLRPAGASRSSRPSSQRRGVAVQQPPLRALPVFTPGAVPPGEGGAGHGASPNWSASMARGWAATSASRPWPPSLPRNTTSSC